ncbi:MAG TPA: hypothetical protein VFQ23_06830, partial [Anaerolineales bacterium]|nr:hypothetical protein [Anaerolineales bacterium]
MRSKINPILFVILSLVFASLACQAFSGGTQPASTSEPQQTEPPQQPVSTATAAQAPVEPATIESQGVGIACVGSGTGLNCINENGWQLYTDENSDLPNNYLYAGAVCPDGKLAIAHISGVALFDGTTFSLIPETDAFSTPDGIACTADGEVWVAHFQGVSQYANGQWTTHGADQLASGESANELIYDVEVAPDGKVWVVTSRSVAMFENGAWTVFQEGQGFNGSRFFNALALDASGRPWAAHSGGVDVFENEAWRSIEKSDFTSPESLAV